MISSARSILPRPDGGNRVGIDGMVLAVIAGTETGDSFGR